MLLTDSERAYWVLYVESLRGGPPPVLTAHPALTRQVLERVGLPAAPVGSRDPGGAGAGSPAAGLHALRTDADLGRVPALEAALRALAGPVHRPGDWIVGVAGAAPLALARAAADGRPFLAVEKLEDPAVAALAERADSLYVAVGEGDPDPMAALQRAADERARGELLPGVPGCPVGYLHARDFAGMTFLDAKQRRPAEPDRTDVVVDATVTEAPPAPGAVALPYRQTRRETVTDQERIGLLAITSHGMSDQIHLNDDYLCGRSPYLAVTDPGSGPLPSCTMPTGAHCFFKASGRPLPVGEIPADHVFVNSCGSLLGGQSDFHPLFSICYSAVDGRARSFAGTGRWKDGHGVEGLLYRYLLRSGRPLGVAIGIVDRVLAGHHLEDGGVWLLLGDPSEQLVRARPEPAQELALGRHRVLLHPGGTEFRVAASGPVSVDGVQARLSTVPAAGGQHAFLLGAAPGEHQIVLRDAGGGRKRLIELAALLRDTLDPMLGLAGLYPDPVRQGARKNLEARVLRLARLEKARYTDPAAGPRLARSWRTLERELDDVDRQTAYWLQDRVAASSYRFSEHYQDVFLLHSAGPGPRCDRCGRTVARRELRHVLRDTVRRVELICPRCGSIEDSPDPALSVGVRLPESVHTGQTVPVDLRLRNDSETAATGYCLVAVRRSAELGLTVEDPVRAVRVPAGGEVEVKFELAAAEQVPTHQYDLQAALVSATRIVLGRQSFWVSPGP